MLDSDVYPVLSAFVGIGVQFAGSTPVRLLMIHWYRHPNLLYLSTTEDTLALDMIYVRSISKVCLGKLMSLLNIVASTF